MKNTAMPRATIIINNYNYGKFLGDAIESALNQSYSNTEVVVVDDGSTDNSRQIIAGYRNRVAPVLKNNGGQASAFNAGFAASSGEWILFLDSDDMFSRCKTAKIVDEGLHNPSAGIIAHNLQYCNTAGATMRFLPPLIESRKLTDGRKLFEKSALLPATSGLCFRRSVLQQILPMPEEIRLTADDYLKSVGRSLAPVLQMPEMLATQRIHGANLYTGMGDIRAGEGGAILCARIEAQIGFEIKNRHPQLKKVAWRHYGRALSRLALLKSEPASGMKAEIRSRYNIMDGTPACYFNVAGAFTKNLALNLMRRGFNA